MLDVVQYVIDGDGEGLLVKLCKADCKHSLGKDLA